jgi:hypothetical protein
MRRILAAQGLQRERSEYICLLKEEASPRTDSAVNCDESGLRKLDVTAGLRRRPEELWNSIKTNATCGIDR